MRNTYKWNKVFRSREKSYIFLRAAALLGTVEPGWAYAALRFFLQTFLSGQATRRTGLGLIAAVRAEVPGGASVVEAETELTKVGVVRETVVALRKTRGCTSGAEESLRTLSSWLFEAAGRAELTSWAQQTI